MGKRQVAAFGGHSATDAHPCNRVGCVGFYLTRESVR